VRRRRPHPLHARVRRRAGRAGPRVPAGRARGRGRRPRPRRGRGALTGRDRDGLGRLVGRTVPHLELDATGGGRVDLVRLTGWTVVYCFPRTGRLDRPAPPGWEAIPGAKGCTAQSCGYRDRHAELLRLGARVFGLSSQSTAYQREAVERLGLPFELLSDRTLAFAGALGLPTFEVVSPDDEPGRLLRRATLLLRAGRVEAAFSPIEEPERDAERVLAWLRGHAR
jgi:peroxiredoxin